MVPDANFNTGQHGGTDGREGSEGTSADSMQPHASTRICDTNDARLELQTPRVMLVIDKSGSMVDVSWDHDDDPRTPAQTRWKSLSMVVHNLLVELEGDVHVGLQLFPSLRASATPLTRACEVQAAAEAAPGMRTAAELIDILPPANAGKNQVAGATPAAAGFEAALATLVEGDRQGPSSVILFTDGAANCNRLLMSAVGEANAQLVYQTYDTDLELLIEHAYLAYGIPTFVVGIDIRDEVVSVPGSPSLNVYEALNHLAMLGGVIREGSGALFYDAGSEAQLSDALDAIVSNLPSCEARIVPAPTLHQSMNLQLMVDGELLDRVELCGQGSGWTWADPAHGAATVLLCGRACSDVAQAREVDVLGGCSEDGDAGLDD